MQQETLLLKQIPECYHSIITHTSDKTWYEPPAVLKMWKKKDQTDHWCKSLESSKAVSPRPRLFTTIPRTRSRRWFLPSRHLETHTLSSRWLSKYYLMFHSTQWSDMTDHFRDEPFQTVDSNRTRNRKWRNKQNILKKYRQIRSQTSRESARTTVTPQLTECGWVSRGLTSHLTRDGFYTAITEVTTVQRETDVRFKFIAISSLAAATQCSISSLLSPASPHARYNNDTQTSGTLLN